MMWKMKIISNVLVRYCINEKTKFYDEIENQILSNSQDKIN